MAETRQQERIDTNLGDLIAAVSDAAIELCGDRSDAYVLASFILEVIFQKNASPISIDGLWN